MKALGLAGEFAVAWTVIRVIGASIDERRRAQWLAAAATGPAAVGVNFLVKVVIARERPLIEEHPPLARAPTKLSFPSARDLVRRRRHSAGRVERRAQPALFLLAMAICVGRTSGCTTPRTCSPGRSSAPSSGAIRAWTATVAGACGRADVKVGIVGLPNAGKSTLFNALTRAGAEPRSTVHHGRPEYRGRGGPG